MILWKFTVREIKNRPGRATLTLLSIIIGVAAVVAVTVGTATTHEAYQEMYESVAGRASLEVVAEGGGFFEEEVAERIAQVPGVTAAVPSVQNPSVLHHQQNHIRLLAIGIDPARDEAVRDYELKEGTFFHEKYGALLETGFARALGIRLGEKVKMPTRHGVKTFTVTGLLSPRGAASFNQGGIIFLPLKTAEHLFGKTGNVNTISIVLADKVDEKAATEAIQGILPTGLSVRSPMARGQLAKETVQSAEQGLNFAYAMMIVLAICMILNTFLMNVGERRRQLAVMRAIGATRRQITRMLLLEGLAMGFVGTVLGSLLGLGGAYLLTQSMGRMYMTAMPALRVTPGPFIVAAFLGPGMSLFAMFVPAYMAGKISPLEGMRFVVSDKHSRIPLLYMLMAVTVFLVTGSALAACILGYLPINVMILSGTIFTAAFVLLIPVVLGALAKLVATVLYPILRVEGQIAHRQVIRRRVRTTLTIGILYFAVSTAISLGTTIINNIADVRTWQTKTLMGDFFVRQLIPDMATGMAAQMPESLGPELRAINGVSDVDAVRFVSASMRLTGPEPRQQQVMVFVRNFSGKGNLPLDIKEGNPADVRQRLNQGEVVLGTVLANRTHTKVGEEITLETRQGPQRLRVAATTTAYMVGGMVVYMEGETARRLLNVEGVDMYIVNTAPGALAGVEAKLKSLCDADGLMLHSFADLRRRIDSLMIGVIASLWGLLALGFIVGAFGIANTLTMNVLEQTRELALLRVVAMTRWQVRKTILAQAIIIGMIGLVMGGVGGITGSYVINLTSVPLLGHAPEFALHPSLIFACMGIGLAVILAAAWFPAERAARLHLLIALQYE